MAAHDVGLPAYAAPLRPRALPTPTGAPPSEDPPDGASLSVGRAGTGPTARERLATRAARLLDALPPRAQVALSGRPPVRVDGQTLDPGLQLSLAVFERRGEPPLEIFPPAEAREALRRRLSVTNGPPPEIGAARDLEIAGAGGPLGARLYSPGEAQGGGSPPPLIVFYHGGGFVLGNLETHDAPCRLLCRHAGACVLSVDYRLAPEHPFPAAVEDGREALRWAVENAAALGADPGRVTVAGDSAGGNLAAVAAWMAARDGGPAPAAQILLYPATEVNGRSRSRELFGRGFLLDRGLLDWFTELYIRDADTSDPRFSILHAGDLHQVAPALVITAGFDPLRDEGEAYAAALRSAGVPVVARRFPALIHGFCNIIGTSRACRDAVIEVSGAARALLARTGSPCPPGPSGG